jgi:hypothetical protein
MKRGLMALDESHMKPLNVLRLIAFGSSVFVLSADWDAHASLEQDFSDEYFGTAFHGEYFSDTSDAHASLEQDFSDDYFGTAFDGEYFSDSSGVDDLKKRRQLVFYEFSRTGVFVQRLVLALHNLTDEGYSQIEGRSPGRPIIGAHFVHFHENIALVGILESVRIDYLFSRNGERLAIWANDLFFDRFRAPFEPQIPSEVAFHPESASSDWLIAFPHHEDYSLGNDLEVLTIQSPELHDLDFEDVTSLYVGVFCDYRTLTDSVNKASASSLPHSRGLPTSLAKYPMTRFKMMLRTFAGHLE